MSSRALSLGSSCTVDTCHYAQRDGRNRRTNSFAVCASVLTGWLEPTIKQPRKVDVIALLRINESGTLFGSGQKQLKR